MLIALFSQYLSKVDVPVPQYSKERGSCYVGRFPLLRLFSVSICDGTLWTKCNKKKSTIIDNTICKACDQNLFCYLSLYSQSC